MRKHDNNIISMKAKFTKGVVVFMFCLKTDELHVLSTCFKNIFDSVDIPDHSIYFIDHRCRLINVQIM